MRILKNLTLLLLLTLLSSLAAVAAGTMPQTSTAEAPVWYMVKFMTGGGVLEAQTNGAKILVGAQAAEDAQYWRIEGDASKGYTFICRKGNMTLYFIQNRQSPFFRTATFGRIIAFATSPAHFRHCAFGEKNGKQYLRFTGITTVAQGVKMLERMLDEGQ